MKTFSCAIKSLFTAGLLAVSSPGFAVPTLNFTGNLIYDGTGTYGYPSDLSITGVLTGFQDLSITTPPDVTTTINSGSTSFSLFADFVSETSNAFTTTGTFGTSAVTDLLITDNLGTGGTSRTLLTGSVITMDLIGPNGFNLGNMSGSLQLDGGALLGDFGGAGALIAFNYNLDTIFGSGMFSTFFTGESNGSIEGEFVTVPEPLPLALLSLGLIAISLTRRIYKQY